MSKLTDRTSYLKGLADGMKLNMEKDTNQLLMEVLNVLQEMAEEMERMSDAHDELNEYVESIDDDLADLEDVLFGDGEDGCDDDCDLLPRQVGTIAFDGTDILSMGPAFRQVLGFMPQSQGMYDDMTAWEFLLYMAQLKGLRPRAAREQLRELLQVVNLWDAAHRRVGGFSGGMRQRVMLAQALLGAPKVLLLDEPTAGLDPEERVRLREYIRQLGRDKIVLITTHITGDVESIASEILLLHHGVLLADAPVEEFIRGCGAANLEDAYIRRLHPHA